MQLDRRFFVSGGLAVLTGPALAQTGHQHHDPLYESLRQPGRIGVPEAAAQQHVFDSPAPKAASAGPLARPGAAAAAAQRDGLGGRARRPDASRRRLWRAARRPALPPRLRPGVATAGSMAAPLPRGANHVGVAVSTARLYAIGGFVEQNRKPHDECFVVGPTAADAWRKHRVAAARLRRDRLRRASRASCTRVGGAIGDTFETKSSVDWHLAYDPARTAGRARAPCMTARDHTGVVAVERPHPRDRRARRHLLHQLQPAPRLRPASRQMGGPRAPSRRRARAMARCSTAARSSAWAARATNRVFGQNEAYDPQTDSLGAVRADEDAAPRPRRGDDRRLHPRRRRRPGDGRRRAKRRARGVHAGVRFLTPGPSVGHARAPGPSRPK